MLNESIIDKIKDSIKKRFLGKDTEELKQNLSDNLGIDENSSVEEIEEKLRKEAGGEYSFPILKKVLYHVSGLAAKYLVWEVQAIIGAGIIKFFDYNPIAVAAVVIYVILSMTDKFEKIRRKVIGKKMDQFIHGKQSYLGDFDRKKEDDKEMNENKKTIRLTESDLTRIVKRVIKEQSTPTPKLEDYEKTFLIKLLTDIKNILSDIFKRTYDENLDEGDRVQVLTMSIFDDYIKKVSDLNYKIRPSQLKWSDLYGRLSSSDRLTILEPNRAKRIWTFIAPYLISNSDVSDNNIFIDLFKGELKNNLKEFLSRLKSYNKYIIQTISLPKKPLQQIPTNDETP
jgi:hypothetical protein